MSRIGKVFFTGIIVIWVVRLIGIVFLLLLLGGVISFIMVSATESPSIDKALWAIQTYSNDAMRIPSRIYYAQKITYLEDGTPVIIGYWLLSGGKFKFVRGDKPFPIDQYGIIDVRRR